MPIYEFECAACGERFEELSPGEVREACRVLEALKAPDGTDRGEADAGTEGPAPGRDGAPPPDAPAMIGRERKPLS